MFDPWITHVRRRRSLKAGPANPPRSKSRATPLRTSVYDRSAMIGMADDRVSSSSSGALGGITAVAEAAVVAAAATAAVASPASDTPPNRHSPDDRGGRS